MPTLKGGIAASMVGLHADSTWPSTLEDSTYKTAITEETTIETPPTGLGVQNITITFTNQVYFLILSGTCVVF